MPVESVVIVSPQDHALRLGERLADHWVVSEEASGVLCVTDGTNRAYISRNEFVAQELEAKKLEFVVSRIGEPVFYTLDYSDLRLCREILAVIADDPEILVDNDHGDILSGSDFVRILRKRPDWDWRLTRP